MVLARLQRAYEATTAFAASWATNLRDLRSSFGVARLSKKDASLRDLDDSNVTGTSAHSKAHSTFLVVESLQAV